MTKHQKQERSRVVLATVVASIVMLTTGIGYRVVMAWPPPPPIPLSPEALARLPYQLGDWLGQESPLDEDVVRATDTDAHVSRTYSRQKPPGSVWLYVAYGVNARDLMPHRPEVCYTGAGWTLVDRRSMELALDAGTKLPCNVLQFSRGTLRKERVVVLDYYVVDEQYCNDVSLLRSKAWRFWRGSAMVDHVAQVQIVASVAPNLAAESAERSVSDFATEFALSISSLFESTEGGRSPDEGRPDANASEEGQ